MRKEKRREEKRKEEKYLAN